MFGSKKPSKEELEYMALLTYILEGKEPMEADFNEISNSRQQLDHDIEQMAERLAVSLETSKKQQETIAALVQEVHELEVKLQESQDRQEAIAQKVIANSEECQKLVDENKYFTTPSKYLCEVPNKLREESKEIVQQMQQVSDSGKQMGVLALNAAIEAGRMGESARGFVSVAEEIRGLSKNYEEGAAALISRINDSEEKIDKLEKTIHQLVGMLKENNIATGRLMKETIASENMVKENKSFENKEQLPTIASYIEELKECESQQVKSGERTCMQIDDIVAERQNVKEMEDELKARLYAQWDKVETDFRNKK